MINRKVQEFVGKVITRGRINYGDVRRLQRGLSAEGITNREELEVLISLNAKLLRADKAWVQWLIATVADFVATREGCGHPIEDAASQWVERLLAASATNLSQKIARQIRRELARLRAVQSTRADEPNLEGMRSRDVQQSSQVGAPENDLDDCSLRNNVGTTDRIAVRPTRKSTGLIAQNNAISQFTAYSPRLSGIKSTAFRPAVAAAMRLPTISDNVRSGSAARCT
jgi:hypothetical protein